MKGSAQRCIFNIRQIHHFPVVTLLKHNSVPIIWLVYCTVRDFDVFNEGISLLFNKPVTRSGGGAEVFRDKLT